MVAKKRTRSDLRDYREAHGLSQTKAARQFGLSQQHWCSIEVGRRYPGRELAARLSRGTGIPVEHLLGMAL